MVIDLEECKSTIGNKKIQLEEQIEYIRGEVSEAEEAVEEYRASPSGKNRAEILFELLDIINATQTAILLEFKEDEVEAGIQYTNAKTYVRGYQKEEEKL